MAHALGLHFLSLLTMAAARSGSDLKPVLASLQLGLHTGDGDPPAWPLSLVAALIEQLEAGTTQGRFVFALADVFNFDGQPAVAAFLASATTLRQLHRLLDWVPVLVHPGLGFEIVDRAPEALLHPRVRSDEPRLHDHPLLIELMTAVAVHLGRVVAPDAPVVRAIDFRHAPHGSIDAYTHWFGCPVRFGADDNTLHGDSRLLDGRLPGALPQAHAAAEETIRRRMLGDGVAPGVSSQVEVLLRRQPALLGDGLAGVAACLHVHPRTLQRQLRAAGTGYADLRDRLREELACTMLRDPALDIDSIALKLGYRERRSFTLAFRHWQGRTPSAYRRQALGVHQK